MADSQKPGLLPDDIFGDITDPGLKAPRSPRSTPAPGTPPPPPPPEEVFGGKPAGAKKSTRKTAAKKTGRKKTAAKKKTARKKTAAKKSAAPKTQKTATARKSTKAPKKSSAHKPASTKKKTAPAQTRTRTRTKQDESTRAKQSRTRTGEALRQRRASRRAQSRDDVRDAGEGAADQTERRGGLLGFELGDVREMIGRLQSAIAGEPEPPASPAPTLLEEEMALDPSRKPCPSCRRSIKKDAARCPHCRTPFFTCPYCKEDVHGVLDKQMEREFELNRILKSYTLFTLVLPSMPYESVYACSHCNSKCILCPSCDAGLKHTAYVCLKCRTKIKRTRLFIDPANLLEQLMEQYQALQTANQLFAPPQKKKR